MGVYKNADASYVVGKGITDGSDYKGFDGQRQIVIQLTADGATDSAMDALNYLKTYAINNAGSGLPIKPSAEVLISANGYTKALEADDFEITDDGMKIGGIVYTSSDDSWDFSNAVSGGSGGQETYEADLNDLSGTNSVGVSTGLGSAFFVALSTPNEEVYGAWGSRLEDSVALYEEVVSAIADGKKVVFTGDLTVLSQQLGSVKMDVTSLTNTGNIGFGGSGNFPYIYPLDGKLYMVRFDFCATLEDATQDDPAMVVVPYSVIALTNIS